MEIFLFNLLYWDEFFFYLLNSVWIYLVLDEVMFWWWDKKIWILLYVVLAGFVIYCFWLRGLYFILGVVLMVGVADIVSSKVMKFIFECFCFCNNMELFFEVE